MNKYEKFPLAIEPGKSVSVPIVSDCKLHYECRVVYKQDMNPELISDGVKESSYKNGDYHTIYYGEIVDCYVK